MATQNRQHFDAHKLAQVADKTSGADHGYQPGTNLMMPLSQLASRQVGGLNATWAQIRNAYYAREANI